MVRCETGDGGDGDSYIGNTFNKPLDNFSLIHFKRDKQTYRLKNLYRMRITEDKVYFFQDGTAHWVSRRIKVLHICYLEQLIYR